MLVLDRLLGRHEPARVAARPRLVSNELPAVIYAIGDVHGCIAELLALERRIVADAAPISGEKWMILVGDYIDRGPASASVVAHLRAPPPDGFRRFCLAGNHEQLFVEALRTPRLAEQWLALGGEETARSYGLAEHTLQAWRRDPRRIVHMLQTIVPDDDVEWLEALPIALSIPGWTFVHAGAQPGEPLERQKDYDLLWTRLAAGLGEQPVIADTRLVHGHTPVSEPIEEPWRICIDTGAYATGRLTALRIREGRETSFLSTISGADDAVPKHNVN